VPEYFDSTRKGRRRDLAIAAGVLLIALAVFLLPGVVQRPLRQVLRGSVLRPFIAGQELVAEKREQRLDVTTLSAQRDSLMALVSAQASLAEENRSLRELLGVRQRAGSAFVPAEVLRAGVPGAESTFLLSVGSADGVQAGSPVIAAGGLVGVVKDVGAHTAQAIDWTHPDFRASAMSADGSAYGIVEARRGAFRENDMLSLTGAPFHSEIPAGTRIVTTGRGGIPIGTVVGIEEADTGWRKSYLLGPAVRPEAVSHVLVGVLRAGGMGADVSALWQVAAPPDTVGQARPDSATAASASAGRATPATGTRAPAAAAAQTLPDSAGTVPPERH
jgi:rod shape-determining protein MreC